MDAKEGVDSTHVTKSLREWKDTLILEREQMYKKMPHDKKTQQDFLAELSLMFQRQDQEAEDESRKTSTKVVLFALWNFA